MSKYYKTFIDGIIFDGINGNPVKFWKLGKIADKLHWIILESKGIGTDMWLIFWSKSLEKEEKQYKSFYVKASPRSWPDLSPSNEKWEWQAFNSNNSYCLRGGTDPNDETKFVWEIVNGEQIVTFSGSSLKKAELSQLL